MIREWTPDLATGIPEIDNQHVVLFGHANQLHTAMQEGTGPQAVRKLMKFLRAYTEIHFAAEEQFMAQTDYPGLGAHRTQHRAFVRELNEYARQIETQGSSAAVILDIYRKIMDWLVTHIGTTDRIAGIFMQSWVPPLPAASAHSR